jgi:hypothetical protein
MSIFTLTRNDCIPPIYNSIKELADYHKSQLKNADDYVIVEELRGKVLFTGERIFASDSDFYAVVWSDEKNAPVEIDYATTRGWTYLNSATVDATHEVQSKYESYLRRKRIIDTKVQRDKSKQKAREMGITIFQLRKLDKAYNGNELYLNPIYKLLKVKRFRSEFRASLAKQIRTWLDNPNPSYETPLSPKQEWLL